jgi:signal transduction histidine kinase
MGAFIVGVQFQLGYWWWPIGSSYIFADLLYVLGAFSIPVCTTIYIGLEYAFTNHALEQKLGEVEELSKKTIEQEIEKQQILHSINETLENQVAARTNELQQSLEDLKSTQTQLIQSEKMASLGELTAGIAHEIQNPLNFVNNFAEVNGELIAEIKQEAQAGNIQGVLQIAEDLQENENKIAHHGRRADAIVKGMLQHSRASTDHKEPTDINALADEYLRLSYHGLRAKDKTFNATLITDFDLDLASIYVVPEEIGRVLLNLYNNAFYAVQQKKAQFNGQYQPEVKVSTHYQDGKVEIKVHDNGNGIPEDLQHKIFQPFFTTKPTGQGTGLGLSLSYDIITKGHGGRLLVDTQEKMGSTFIIQLPKTG